MRRIIIQQVGRDRTLFDNEHVEFVRIAPGISNEALHIHTDSPDGNVRLLFGPGVPINIMFADGKVSISPSSAHATVTPSLPSRLNKQ